jgi:chromosome segregation ATPase
MPGPEKSFLERVKERAKGYKEVVKRLFDAIKERTTGALKLLPDIPFLAAAGFVEASIEVANRGREAVRAGVKAIKEGADEAMRFGGEKKKQAINFLSGIVEAAKRKVRDARDALVNRVNEARRRVGEQIKKIREDRERAGIEAELREIGQRLNEIDKAIQSLLAEKERLGTRIYDLNQRWRQLQETPESPFSTS